MQTHIFPDDDEAMYVLLKERIERLYSFGNGVARIRLCKCWQLICVQLLGNQKYNGSSLFCISYMKIYCTSFQKAVFHDAIPSQFIAASALKIFTSSRGKTRWQLHFSTSREIEATSCRTLLSSHRNQNKLSNISICQTFRLLTSLWAL